MQRSGAIVWSPIRHLRNICPSMTYLHDQVRNHRAWLIHAEDELADTYSRLLPLIETRSGLLVDEAKDSTTLETPSEDTEAHEAHRLSVSPKSSTAPTVFYPGTRLEAGCRVRSLSGKTKGRLGTIDRRRGTTQWWI